MSRFAVIILLLQAIVTGCGKPKDGKAGPQGAPGVAGQGCTVAQVLPTPSAPYGGALVSCNGGSVLLTNGAPGPQGEPGPVSSYGVVEVIDPCGDAPGIYDEVLLRLSNGQILSSFSDNANGANTRLSLLAPGSYETSDGSACFFTLNADGSVT